MILTNRVDRTNSVAQESGFGVLESDLHALLVRYLVPGFGVYFYRHDRFDIPDRGKFVP